MSHTPSSMRGYTLLEMIVSVGLFAIVMLAATGAYLSLVKLDRHARAVNSVANNLSFAIDSMARSIRTGTEYACDANSGSPNCTATPGDSFSFEDSEVPSRSVVYAVSDNQLVASIDGGTPVPLTDPRVHVESLSFYVRGVGTGDGTQPQVIFNIQGTMSTGPTASTTFVIQAGATQRLLEL